MPAGPTTAAPVWFGPARRPLLGWLHAPAGGAARAGAVICPPLVREHLQAHVALRLLGEELGARGVAALRIDYDGTGDSAGCGDDPGRLAAWLASIHAGARLLRETGAGSLCLVGMGLGATLAARAAAGAGGVDQLVLWDPCPSGHRYLREQRLVGALTPAGARTLEDGSLDTPGLVLRPETLGELRGLRLDALERPVARRVLVLSRPDRRPEPAATAGLGSEAVEHAEAVGQAALMDVPAPWQAPPTGAVRHIAGWVAAGAQGPPVRLRPPPPAGPAVVALGAGGEQVVEEPVRVGPAGLAGIRTAPAGPGGPPPRAGAAAVFLNVANGHHVGPGRLWVDLARRWATLGVASLRVDLSGLGESPVRHPGQQPYVVRAPEAFADVADAARAASPADPRRVVLVGLCSAAYQALDSALALHPLGVVSVNPVLTFVPPELQRGQPLDPRRRVALPRTPVVEAFHDVGRLAALRRLAPGPAWRARLWAHPGRRPARWLPALVHGGTDVLLVVGEREVRPVRYGSSGRLRARLARTGRFHLVHLPELEHGLLVGPQRDLVADLVTAHVAARFAPPAPGPAAPAGAGLTVRG